MFTSICFKMFFLHVDLGWSGIVGVCLVKDLIIVL